MRPSAVSLAALLLAVLHPSRERARTVDVCSAMPAARVDSILSENGISAHVTGVRGSSGSCTYRFRDASVSMMIDVAEAGSVAEAAAAMQELRKAFANARSMAGVGDQAFIVDEGAEGVLSVKYRVGARYGQVNVRTSEPWREPAAIALARGWAGVGLAEAQVVASSGPGPKPGGGGGGGGAGGGAAGAADTPTRPGGSTPTGPLPRRTPSPAPENGPDKRKPTGRDKTALYLVEAHTTITSEFDGVLFDVTYSGYVGSVKGDPTALEFTSGTYSGFVRHVGRMYTTCEIQRDENHPVSGKIEVETSGAGILPAMPPLAKEPRFLFTINPLDFDEGHSSGSISNSPGTPLDKHGDGESRRVGEAPLGRGCEKRGPDHVTQSTEARVIRIGL